VNVVTLKKGSLHFQAHVVGEVLTAYTSRSAGGKISSKRSELIASSSGEAMDALWLKVVEYCRDGFIPSEPHIDLKVPDAAFCNLENFMPIESYQNNLHFHDASPDLIEEAFEMIKGFSKDNKVNQINDSRRFTFIAFNEGEVGFNLLEKPSQGLSNSGFEIMKEFGVSQNNEMAINDGKVTGVCSFSVQGELSSVVRAFSASLNLLDPGCCSLFDAFGVVDLDNPYVGHSAEILGITKHSTNSSLAAIGIGEESSVFIPQQTFQSGVFSLM